MDKLAQDRGMINKIREKTNLTGKILESLNPEFQEMMDKLRATDEKIRSYAEEVKPLVRAAKSYTNRRDYLAAATNISAFHEKCRYISAELQKFISGVDMKHYKFLLDQFDDNQKEQLFGYDPNKEINTDDTGSADDKVVLASLKKQAGLSDWWFKMTDPIGDVAHNLTTQRGIAMKALEKRFSISFLKDLKSNTVIMVNHSERFLNFLLAIFKRLAHALMKRNVDQYVTAAKTFISKFGAAGGFHARFVKYYETSVVPLKDQYKKLQEAQLEADRAANEQRSTRMEQGPRRPAPEVSVPGLEGKTGPLPMPRAPVPGYDPEAMDKPEEEEVPFDLKKPKAAEFINKLEKFAKTNNPKSLLLEILAFSEMLENTDPNTSLKLLAIAEGMVEDYKTAGIFDFFKDKPDATVPAKQEETPDPLL